MNDFLNFMDNCQPVFYKLYEGQEEIIDMWGNPTGSFVPKYSGLKSAMLCVSPNKGSSEVEQFGSTEDYDRTMTTADPNCPIDENTVLWVDGAETDGPWNYIVKEVGRWKNSTQYAIKKVTVSQYQAQQEEIRRAQEMKERALENQVEPEP